MQNAETLQLRWKVDKLQLQMANNRLKRIPETSPVQSRGVQTGFQKRCHQAVMPQQKIAVSVCRRAFVVFGFHTPPPL
jgi:hypothetical protein